MKKTTNGILTLLLAFFVQLSFAQERTISGTVSDEDGPLPEVSILIKGTTSGVVTDFDGNYSIKAKTGDVLVFNSVGYADVEKKVGLSNTIDVLMKTEGTIKEVVIEAYSNKTISKEKSTSAITTLSSETIDARPNASVVQTLQGQVSGLNIGTGSGQPGSNSTIILRGVGSINGNIEPLFIVDGVPVDEDNFRSINNSDIATVSVLKDASASSLYGSRGANGAIIITTKRGKFDTSSSIKYKSQLGYSFIPNPNFKVMNSFQKLNFDRDNNEGLGAGLSDAQINAIANQTNTNWSDIFFQDGFSSLQNLSISSGSDKTNSYTSFGYFDQNGVTRRSKLKRFSFRNNFSGKSENERFNYGTNFTANFSKSDFIQNEGQGSLANPFLVPYVSKPYYSAYNPDGSLNTVGANTDSFANTPYTSLNNTLLNIDNEEEIKIVGSVNANYEILKNITAGLRFGLDFTETSALNILHPNSIYGQTIVASGSGEYQGAHFESTVRDVRFNNVSSLNYNNEFNDKHTLDFTAFMEYSKSHLKSNSFNQTGINPKLVGFGTSFIPGGTYEDLNNDGTINGSEEFPYIPSVGSGNIKIGLFSYFGVLKYDFDERYGLQLSARRDASSRFSQSNKWGTFYAASLRWNIHNESFMKDGIFNNLKVRVSYGTSGNDRISSSYYGSRTNTYDLYSQGTGYNGTVSYLPSQIANTDLKWETTTQTNIGLDFGLWGNKLRGNLDVYSKDTDDLFQNQPISSLNGTNSIAANIGAMNNKGIELYLNWRAIKSENFKLEIFANSSYNKNEITKLPNGEDVDGGGRTILSEGQPIGSFYAVRWAGVNPANGNNLYLDADGNLTETYSLDNRVFIDKAIYPTYQGGFGFNADYKKFSLDTQFSYVADIYRNNGSLGVIEDPTLTSISNSSVTLLNAWQQVGDVTSIPSLSTTSIRNRLTDRYIEDASYLRLRNVSLGYSFKDVLAKTTFIDDMKIYVQAENIITWSKWRGWDPESNFRSSDFFNYPTPKIYSFGFELKF